MQIEWYLKRNSINYKQGECQKYITADKKQLMTNRHFEIKVVDINSCVVLSWIAKKLWRFRKM